MASKSGGYHMLEDLTIAILLKLPVKSLTRFKCVCKYWYTLIRSSTFVKKHLHHQSNNVRLLVHHYNYNTEKYSFALFQDETLASFPLLYDEVDDVQIPNDPKIFGHYDGILGLCDWDNIALWNPATREFRFLPMPNPNIPPDFTVFIYRFGFGLDPTTNDYKVVWIRTYADDYEDYHSAVIVVFYLSTNSWRLFEADLSRVAYVHESSCSTCLNGVYYWLTSVLDKLGLRTTYYYNAILTFDLSNEVFGDIPGPQDIPVVNWGNLIIYNDSISVMCFDPREVEKYVDIWVMKEEGCWTKQLTMGPVIDVDRALGFWKNGELFLETTTSKLVLYNPNTQEIKDLQHRGLYNSLRIFMYKESLVSIKGENECWEGDDVSNTA
ncbi:putative F-box protein At1g32420 [Cornus florida]|uniref:putative F-box protein At1g32420 n=1 Tax=Cornus florida TaxID=4283 RepID=UPI00289F7F9A|nr:putative F-box protein At1g32420 [Cornus florida]